MNQPKNHYAFVAWVFAALAAAILAMAGVQFIAWGPASVLLGAVVLAAFLINARYEKDMTYQRADAERRAQLREREKAEHFATLRSKIVQGFPEPLLMIDADRQVVEANRPARDMFGENIVGNDVFFYLRQPQALEVVRAAIETDQPEQREFQVLTPFERYYSIHANRVDQAGTDGDDAAQPVKSQNYYVVISLQDITQMKMSDKMRVDFIANASHELRTPLSALTGFIETLRGPAAEDSVAQKKFLAIMAQEAERMARVIDDLLSLSRIELGKHVRPRDSVDLGSIARNVRQTMHVALTDSERTLVVNIVPKLPKILGDRDQLIQVLQNLITNAIKYSQAGTQITLNVSQHNDQMVQVQVIDQGEGIAPEHIPRLTERFYRIDTARSRQIGGTGLGLAIVKHIMERHDGELAIESELGVGTTITLLFKIDPDAASAKHREDAQVKPATGLSETPEDGQSAQL